MTIRVPHFSKLIPRKVQQPHLVANLLVTTLAVAAAAPFVPLEPFVPQQLVVQQPVQLSSPVSLLEVIVEKPFAQHDWPNPRTTRLYEVLQRSQAITEIVTVPFTQLDWPNPTVDRQVQQPFQFSSPLTLIGIVGEKPFNQTDWPNPKPLFTQQPAQLSKSIALVEP
ncbi:MAG: hypothetical protein O7D34_02270, partial [Ignavibacteria bacterium]|nr:hypothetical protein [Ignavibacteria bacterium]